MGAFVPPPGQPHPLQPSEFVSASQPSVVTFNSKNIQPPAPLYVRPEEGLLIKFINSSGAAQTARLSYRLILPNGQLQVAQQDLSIANSAGVYQAQFVALPEGFLLDVSVTMIGNIARGQLFCLVYVARGTTSQNFLFATLIQDYLFTNAGVSWPNGSITPPTAGPGFCHAIVFTTPAAGADFSVTLGVSQRVRIQGFTANFTTSATVATRIPRFTIGDQGNRIISKSPPQNTVPASTSVSFSTFSGQITSTADPTTDTWVMPGNPIVTGPTIQTSTNAIQAGDQWSLGVLYVEEWIEP